MKASELDTMDGLVEGTVSKALKLYMVFLSEGMDELSAELKAFEEAISGYYQWTQKKIKLD